MTANSLTMGQALISSRTSTPCGAYGSFLLQLDAPRSIGFGLEPGDHYYEEPYFYVNLSPAPAAGTDLGALAGDGSWHTREWIGAVLPGSRLAAASAEQERQVHAFLESAIGACRKLLP